MLFCTVDTCSLLSRTTREKMMSVKSPGHYGNRQRIRNTIALKETVISLGEERPGKQLSVLRTLIEPLPAPAGGYCGEDFREDTELDISFRTFCPVKNSILSISSHTRSSPQTLMSTYCAPCILHSYYVELIIASMSRHYCTRVK